jgi:hypothetical protein
MRLSKRTRRLYMILIGIATFGLIFTSLSGALFYLITP